MRRVVAIFCATVLLASLSRSQEDFPHPELEWRTIETAHFQVHFHQGAERTARVVAKIAEEIYGPVTAFYRHEPDSKVSFVIRDYDDIANGAAYFYDNKIEIYASNMDFELRGTHNWLRNVVTHEFTHIVQIQTSMKMGRTVPSIYFQWLNYEDERRPDVLYGYPNTVVSYPISGFSVPAWFAEGVAQYNRPELRYDYWDAHRDMILRSYALDGNMLGWEEMGVFGKTSLGNESAYNAGFAFVSYIAQRYGEAKLREISVALSGLGVVSIDMAISKALGKAGAQVYAEWRSELEKDYAERSSAVKATLRRGDPLVVDSTAMVIDPEQMIEIEAMARPRGRRVLPAMAPCCAAQATVGFANLYPVYSPDGTRVAYCSAKGADYFGLSSLFVYDFTTRKETLVQPGVRTAAAWSPDGKKLYYAKNGRENPHWSLVFDLYAFDLEKREERRLTYGRRVLSPTVSSDGQRLMCVANADGTTNLAQVGTDGTGFRLVTSFTQGEQVYNPRWAPDEGRVVFDLSSGHGRDLAEVDTTGNNFRLLVSGPADDRNATFAPDGSTLYYSSDRTGIFNVYAMDLRTGDTRQVTNVLGGAFYPTVNASGTLLYALYTSHGYKIFRLADAAAGGDSAGVYVRPQGLLPYPHMDTPVVDGSFDWEALRSYDDRQGSAADSRPYKGSFSSLTVVPFLRVDNYNASWTGLELLKPGAILFSNDVLDRVGFLAGAAMNIKLERDLFLIFDYRGKVPLLYQLGLEPTASFELYNVTRKGAEADVDLGLDQVRVGVSYSLLEFDFALRQKAFSQFMDLEFRYAHSRYTSLLDSFVFPATGELQPATSDLYLIGNTLALTGTVDAIIPSRTSGINPVGRRFSVKLSYEFNKFAATDSAGYRQYEVVNGYLEPVYERFDFPRLELGWKEYLPFFFRHHTLMLSARFGTIFGPVVDEYFDFYAGGLIGMRGYPYYSISGNSMAAVGFAYRFPISNDLGVRIFQIYFDKLYASVYGDAGDAWTGGRPTVRGLKTDLGMQLRMEAFSFYAYPTAIFFDAAYGLTRFDRYVRSANSYVTYGKEWRFYFGILFGFDFD